MATFDSEFLYGNSPIAGVAADSAPGETLFLTGGGAPPAASLTYRMRGFDTNLGRIVYWTATEVDADASEYSSPGDITLSTVVVFKYLGLP